MTGTWVNTGAILVGSLIGMTIGKHLPEGLKTIVMQGLGLSVILVGLRMPFSRHGSLTSTGCLLLGVPTGELIRIEQRIEWFGRWLKKRTGSGSANFVQGFVTASIFYLTVAMVIVGSIKNGTVGDANTLYLKSRLDGVASIALSSTLAATDRNPARLRVTNPPCIGYSISV